MDLPVTHQQIHMWKSGMLIQQCMPNLNVQQREFLISGMTIKEQDEFFK